MKDIVEHFKSTFTSKYFGMGGPMEPSDPTAQRF